MAKLDYGNIKTDEMLKSLERRLKKEYQQAAQETEKKLKKYMEGFEKRDKEKLDLVKAGKLSQKDYEQWRVGQIATGQRWTAMRDVLAEDMTHTNEIAAGIINGKMPDIYALNMNYGTFEVEKASSVDTSFTLYNRDAVNNIVKEDKDLLPKASINHAKDIRYNRKQFQSHMIQGLLQGESIPNIAKRLPRAVGETNLNGAIRRARTMTTGVENGGRLEAYKRAQDLGIEGKMEWIATLDSRTRHSHAILDGERVNVGETFSNGLEYAGDPSGDAEEVYNCRCRTQFVLKDFERDATDLTQRYSDIGDMSYDEWQDEHRRKYKETQERKITKREAKNDDYLKSAYEEHRKINNLNVTPYDELGTFKSNVVGANWENVSRETVNKFDETLHKLTTSYDTPLTKVRTMDKMESIGNSAFASTYHNYSVDSAEILFNPLKCGDYEKMAVRIKELSQKGYAVRIKDGLEGEYIPTHEFAHSLVNMKEKLSNSKNYVGANYDKIKKVRNEIDGLYNEYLKEVEPLQKSFKSAELDFIMGGDGQKAINAIQKLDKIKLSNYSLENSDEFFAEAFTQYRIGASKTKYAEKVGEIVEKYFGK